METAGLDSLGSAQKSSCLFQHGRSGGIDIGGDGKRHGEGFAFHAGRQLKIVLDEFFEQSVELASEEDESVPGSEHGEVIPAAIKDGYFAPELRQGTEQRELAREKLLEQHRQMDVFLDRVRLAQPDVK